MSAQGVSISRRRKSLCSRRSSGGPTAMGPRTLVIENPPGYRNTVPSGKCGPLAPLLPEGISPKCDPESGDRRVL